MTHSRLFRSATFAFVIAMMLCSSQAEAQLFRFRNFQPAPIFRAPQPMFQQQIQPRVILNQPMQQRFVQPQFGQPQIIQGQLNAVGQAPTPVNGQRPNAQPNAQQPNPLPGEQGGGNSILENSGDIPAPGQSILTDKTAEPGADVTAEKKWDPSQGYDNDDQVIRVVEPKNDGLVRIRYPKTATEKLAFKVNGVPGTLAPGHNLSIPAGTDFKFSFMPSVDGDEVEHDVSKQGEFVFVQSDQGWKVEAYAAPGVSDN